MAYTTSESLLREVKNGDSVSWDKFYRNYSRLIWVCAEDFHLSAEERKELIQMVMLEVFKSQSYFNYSRERGRFRDYLKKIVRHQVFRIFNQRSCISIPATLDAENTEEEDWNFEQIWELEWRHYLVAEALNILREKMEPITYSIFVAYALNHEAPETIAKKCAVSVNSVYLIKSRGTAILRNLIKILKESY